jgi:hypothetical protein
MTVAVTANPASIAPSGATSASGATDGDGGAFSDLMSGMDPRRAATGTDTGQRRRASSVEVGSTEPANGEDDPGDRPSFGATATRKKETSSRHGDVPREVDREASDPSVARPAPGRDAEARADVSVHGALLDALSVSERKGTGEKNSEGEKGADRGNPDATSAVGPMAGAVIALRVLLGEHRIAASEPGRVGRAEPAVARHAGGSARGGTIGADDAAAPGSIEGGPDPFAGLPVDAVPDLSSGRIGTGALPVEGMRHADVEVLDRATWLPPAITPDNLRQITDAVLTAAKEPAGTSGSSTSPVAAALSTDLQSGLKSHDVVKSLTIRLQPDELGTLTANLRLSGETMTLHITASRSETAQMLMADKDDLVSVLKEAGLTAGHVVVTIADPLSTAAGGSASGTGSQGQFGGQPSGQPAGQSFAGGQGGSSGGNRQPDDRSAHQRSGQGGADPAPGPETRSSESVDRRSLRRGDLYL